MFIAPQAEVRLECTADTSICIHPDERRLNHGGRPVLRIKGIEHILLLDFDLAPIRGRTVTEARIFLHAAGPLKLKTLGLSTVATAWKEGASNGEAQPGESCFLQAAYGERDWAGVGSDFHAVTFGSGGSLWFARTVRDEADGWLSVDAPPELLHAMVEGTSCGIAVSDEKGQTLHNNDVHAREQSGFAPCLVVTSWRDGSPPPSGARLWHEPATLQLERVPLFPRLEVPAARSPAGFRLLHEGEQDPSRSAAHLWNGRAISLEAARGEQVAFQIALDEPGFVSGEGWTVSSILPVGSTWDPLVPAAAHTFFHVERHVSKSESPGVEQLSLHVGDVDVPVELRVHLATVPDTLAFHVSLNTYGTPQPERGFHRLAHEHRATLAIVPYSHHGRVEDGCAPVLGDWSEWDARFGPLFDGSAFRRLPRDGVPLDHFYLPFHESWPTPIRAAYRYSGSLEDHWRDAPEIQDTFPDSYAQSFRAAIEETGRHLNERSWTHTDFHVYLNNKNLYWKPDVDACWWTLDEPMFRDDFLAIRYFAELVRDGLKEAPGAPIRFRIDLSRPQWRRNHLDGLIGLDVVAQGVHAEQPRYVFGRGEEVWIYGGLDMNASRARAWVVQAWLDGADGVVPWQTVGGDEAWRTPEETAILLPRDGAAFPTLRLKMLRRGEQDVELLRQLLAARRLSREQVREEIAAALGDPDRAEALRRALLAALK